MAGAARNRSIPDSTCISTQSRFEQTPKTPETPATKVVPDHTVLPLSWIVIRSWPIVGKHTVAQQFAGIVTWTFNEVACFSHETTIVLRMLW